MRTVEKTKTKTVVAVALVTLAVVGTVAALIGALNQNSGEPNLNATNIVATIYSSEKDGVTTCKTATDSETASQGYWDLGNYSSCVSNQPTCTNGSKKVTMADSLMPDGSVKYHTVCVLPGQTTATNIVATIYSSEKDGVTTCKTAADSETAAQGYWDSGSYSSCVSNQPTCTNGSKKVTMADSLMTDGSVKYHTVCVLPGQTTATNIVATIYSSEKDGVTTCKTATDSETASQGYWDLGNYSSCVSNQPTCTNGSKKVTMADSLMPDGSVKYHTFCVLPGQTTATNIVATIYSETGASTPGETASLTATPASFDFGDVQLNSNKDQRFTLKNSGTSSLTINSINGISYFSLITNPGDCANGKVLNQNETCYLNIRFLPTQAESFSGNYEINYDSGKKLLIAVSGKGIGEGGGSSSPSLTASPTTVDFGNVTIGTNGQSTVTARNAGSQNTTISTITADSPFSINSSASTCSNGKTLTPNETCTIVLIFTPTEVTSRFGTSRITYNGGASTRNVNLQGKGIAGISGGGSGLSDLIITNVTQVGAISDGSRLSVLVTVKNQGTGAAGPSKVKATKGTTTLLLDIDTPSIPAGQTVQVNGEVTFTCPTHNSYYLQYNADGYSQVAESDETNNQRVTSITCNR